jgi:hypothetical protein
MEVRPGKGGIIIRSLFWFGGIPVLDKSVLNLTVKVHKSWKVAVKAPNAQQKCLNSLAEAVLQNQRGLDILTAAAEGLYMKHIHVYKYIWKS